MGGTVYSCIQKVASFFMGQRINPDMALLRAGSKSDEFLPFFPIKMGHYFIW